MDPMQIGLKILLFVCPLVLDSTLPCIRLKCERSLDVYEDQKSQSQES